MFRFTILTMIESRLCCLCVVNMVSWASDVARLENLFLVSDVWKSNWRKHSKMGGLEKELPKRNQIYSKGCISWHKGIWATFVPSDVIEFLQWDCSSNKLQVSALQWATFVLSDVIVFLHWDCSSNRQQVSALQCVLSSVTAPPSNAFIST